MQSISFVASNTPVNGVTYVTAESVSTDLLNLINDYNLPVGGNKIDIASVLGLIYPIGSIYTNASVATNPATLLGFGTWTAFGTGQVLTGIDAGQAEFATLGLIGGAKTQTHTVTAHIHALVDGNIDFGLGGGSGGAGTGSGHAALHNANTGGASASTMSTESILQPYITVYMWQRTA